MTVPISVQDGEVRRAFQRSLQKQGLKFKLSTKVCGTIIATQHQPCNTSLSSRFPTLHVRMSATGGQRRGGWSGSATGAAAIQRKWRQRDNDCGCRAGVHRYPWHLNHATGCRWRQINRRLTCLLACTATNCPICLPDRCCWPCRPPALHQGLESGGRWCIYRSPWEHCGR